jgi:nicotinate-nucleotide adenylyltransferase
VSSERQGARVALFGGSFNPPHVAHVMATVYALSTAPIDEVLIVPVFRHPFAKELAPFPDRMAMSRLALGWIPHVHVSAVEEELGGESLTLRTVEHLGAAHPEWSLRLLVGADVLVDVPKWHRWDRIAELAPPLVLGRAGIESGGEGPLRRPEPVLPRVSSTEVREALAKGDADLLRRLVPASVLAYIEEHGLYRRGAR